MLQEYFDCSKILDHNDKAYAQFETGKGADMPLQKSDQNRVLRGQEIIRRNLVN